MADPIPFDGFLGGYLAGEQHTNAQRDRARADDAYNALASIYGPVAGDPVAYGQLAGITRNEAAFPLEQEGRRLGNENTAQQTNFLAQLQPATVERAQLGNESTRQAIDFNAQMQPIAVEGAQLGNEAARGTLGDADTQRKMGALRNSFMLLKRVKDGGGDLAATIDRLAPALVAAGYDAAEIEQARPAIVANPQLVDQILESMMDPAAAAKAAAAGTPTGPASEADKYRQRGLGTEAAKAEADVFDLERTGAKAIGASETVAAAPLRSIDALLDPKMLKDTFGYSTVGSYLPTSNWRGASNRLTTLKDQILLQTMSQLKALSPTGSTGFGNLTEREGARLENSLGKLDPYTSEEEGKKILTEIRDQIQSFPVRARKLLEDETKAARDKAESLNRRVDEQGAGAAPQGFQAQYDALPPGARYVGPDGKTRVKR